MRKMKLFTLYFYVHSGKFLAQIAIVCAIKENETCSFGSYVK